MIEDYYYNPQFTLFVASLLVFVLIFSILAKLRQFRDNKSVPAIVAGVFAVYFAYRFRDLRLYEVMAYNTAIALAAVSVVLVLFIIFFKFFKKQF